MYTNELHKDILPIDSIYLDPNNPRFWTEKTTRDIPDIKIPDARIQQKTFDDISRHGIEELHNSILRNGFLPLDRIVVRPINGHEGQYVVVEGNRRLAALRLLRYRIDNGVIDEEHIDENYLRRIKESTERIEVLVYKGSEAHDIAWLLQGIRHISGIRDWQPAQRARLVTDQIEKQGLGFKEAGQRFGLSARAVGRLYRAYKALEQMRNDEEFSSKAKNEYFSLFEEAIRNREVSDWLGGWDDNNKIFRNIDNLKQFYAWISPDEDHGDDRRIHDPKHIKKLGYLLNGNWKSLLDKIDQYELGIDSAYDRATSMPDSYDWKAAIERAQDLVAEIPQGAIASNPHDVIRLVESLEEKLKTVKAMARAVNNAE